MISQPTLEEKTKEFKHFTIDEIDKVIGAKANYLAALGLSAYTEFLGGLYRCKLEDREVKNNYNEGLKKLGSEYHALLNNHGDDIYKRIRCGLVHEFFIKGTIAIIWLENSNCKCGIEIDFKGDINFYPRRYLDDFNRAIDTYIGIMKKDMNLQNYFLHKWRAGSTIVGSGCTTLPP